MADCVCSACLPEKEYSWICDSCGCYVTSYAPGAFDAPPPDATQMFCVGCACYPRTLADGSPDVVAATSEEQP